MNIRILLLVIFLIAGCSASELNHSLLNVTGKNVTVIRTYPTKTFVAPSGNTVYTYSNFSCDIYFEVDKENTILVASYKGDACNSFYNDVLKPR